MFVERVSSIQMEKDQWLATKYWTRWIERKVDWSSSSNRLYLHIYKWKQLIREKKKNQRNLF